MPTASEEDFTNGIIDQSTIQSMLQHTESTVLSLYSGCQAGVVDEQSGIHPRVIHFANRVAGHIPVLARNKCPKSV